MIVSQRKTYPVGKVRMLMLMLLRRMMMMWIRSKMGFLLGEVGPWRIDNCSIHRIETEESTSP